MTEKNNLEKLLEIKDIKEFFDFAGTCGLPQNQVDQLKKLIDDVTECYEQGGRKPVIKLGHLTAGSEFQQGALVTFGFEDTDEKSMAYVIVFDPTMTFTVGSKAYSQEEFNKEFKKLPVN